MLFGGILREGEGGGFLDKRFMWGKVVGEVKEQKDRWELSGGSVRLDFLEQENVIDLLWYIVVFRVYKLIMVIVVKLRIYVGKEWQLLINNFGIQDIIELLDK